MVRVRRAVLEDIAAHAREEAPYECCGLLVSDAGEIVSSVRTPSLARSETRYRVDPRAHIALNKELRGTPRLVAGAYHSHPRAPAVPSASDVAEAHYPDFVYVIVSLLDPDAPDIRGYRIAAGGVTPVAFIVSEGGLTASTGRCL